MSRFLLFLIPLLAGAQPWSAVQSLAPGTKIQVRTEATKDKGTLFSVTDDAVVLRDKRGEHSFRQTEVREVKARSLSRQIRRGVIGTAIGIGAGVALSFAVCPSCKNEGNHSFVRYGAQGGGFFAAFLSFPFPAYKTIYKTPLGHPKR